MSSTAAKSAPLQAIEVKLLDPRFGDEWPLPAYATEASAGMDLRAALEAPLTLASGDTALIPSCVAHHARKLAGSGYFRG
jgi:dUTP pyrophosphatase